MTRSRAATANSLRSVSSSRSERSAWDRLSGSPGGTSRPVTPSTTTSASPPTAVATTGTPHAIASSATAPDGSQIAVA